MFARCGAVASWSRRRGVATCERLKRGEVSLAAVQWRRG
ncbi:Hypothetical protein A7982_04872 [Minicystis rosea]|nr:Hypothetical protein A7982_04872 [Minicystis rosea]